MRKGLSLVHQAPPLSWKSTTERGSHRVNIVGRADRASESALATLEEELTGQDELVLDVAGLQFVDSTFLRFLLRLQAHARSSQQSVIRLVGENAQLTSILAATGLNRIFAYDNAPLPNHS